MREAVFVADDESLKAFRDRKWWGGASLMSYGEEVSLGVILSALGLKDDEINWIGDMIHRTQEETDA